MKSLLLHFSFFIFRFSFFILIVLQSYSPAVLSQPADYQLFRQDAQYFFHQSDDWYGEVVGIRFDASVEVADGTEWYNHYAIQDINTDPYAGWCYSPAGPSWMGYKLLVRPNGDNLLYGINKDDLDNIFYDTILIKTRATTGDSWEYLFAGPNTGPSTIASLTRRDTMTFLGITDSVKVISLGEDSIILSKNHGLVRTLNFRDYLPDSYYAAYELAGITSTDTVIGRGLLTFGEIYNYEIGDVFHQRIYIEGASAPDIYNVFEVLDKYFSSGLDTVYYQMGRIEWWYYIGGLSEINFDTLTESYYNLDEILYDGRFPAETMWFPDSSAVYSYELYYDNATYNGRMMYHGPFEIFPSPVFPDTCFDRMGADYTTYIEGCGDFTHFYGDYHNCMPCQRLDYFKKGDEEWGTPYEIPVGIIDHQPLTVKIYPVPAGDFVMIDLEIEDNKDVTITLSDISGRILLEKTVLPDQFPCRLELSPMESSFFLLKISSGDKVTVRKIIH